jgi:predicted transcriptional regulator of viral defense system
MDSIGVAPVSAWLASGLSERQLARRVSTGELVRIRHGIYARASLVEEATQDQGLAHALHVAGVIGKGKEMIASHQSAAMMRGLDQMQRPLDGTVTVTVPPGARSGPYRRAGVVRHGAELPAAHVSTLFGLPVTTAARTVADIARSASFMEGVVVADSALHQRWASKTELRRVLVVCDRWPGASAARAVVGFANGLSESVLESCARVVFHERGLPPPELQIPVFDEKGSPIARVDFLWREHGVVAEADGLLKYQAGADAIAELKRDRLLRDQDLEVVHFTWAELFGEPERVVNRILEAFRRARRLNRPPT